ncbi:MAG TPA: AI-2E family transporter, partial [Anaeromyxobacter sp.]
MRRGSEAWAWVKATAAVTLTALAIGVSLWALWRAQVALTLTVLALLVAVALDRPVSWLERHRVRRGVGIGAVSLVVVLALGALVFVFVPPAAEQLRELSRSGPELLERIQESTPYRFVSRHVDLNAALQRLRERGPAMAGDLLGPAVAVFSAVAGAIAGLVTLLFIVVFMLASGPQLVRAALAKARPERRPIYAEVLSQIYRSLGGYIGGLFVLVISNMFFSGVFLAVVGIPYFLPLAVFSGLSSLVPYAGAIAAGSLLSLVGWANGGPWLAVGTLAYFVAYQQVESYLIAPLVYRRAVDLNPLVIMLVVLFMAELDGIPGAVVAVPLAATAQIVLGELFRLRRQRLEPARVPPGPHLPVEEPDASSVEEDERADRRWTP